MAGHADLALLIQTAALMLMVAGASGCGPSLHELIQHGRYDDALCATQDGDPSERERVVAAIRQQADVRIAVRSLSAADLDAHLGERGEQVLRGAIVTAARINANGDRVQPSVWLELEQWDDASQAWQPTERLQPNASYREANEALADYSPKDRDAVTGIKYRLEEVERAARITGETGPAVKTDELTATQKAANAARLGAIVGTGVLPYLMLRVLGFGADWDDAQVHYPTEPQLRAHAPAAYALVALLSADDQLDPRGSEVNALWIPRSNARQRLMATVSYRGSNPACAHTETAAIALPDGDVGAALRSVFGGELHPLYSAGRACTVNPSDLQFVCP
jgi:hypothetical protein